MKNIKKKVLVGALVVSLAALVSAGSIAWFSASDTVQNKFMVASSDQPDDPDNEFDVDVWEKTPDNNKDPDGTEYPDVMPGDTLTKEPHVENTGKYDEYIRIIVTVSDADAWAGLLSTDTNTVAPADVQLTDIVTEFNDIGFALDADYTPVYTADNNGTLTFVYYGNGILPAGAETWIFKDVKIPDSMTEEQADHFSRKTDADGNVDEQGSFTIDVKAQAVQTKNLDGGKSTVFEQAKYAFETVDMAITG